MSVLTKHERDCLEDVFSSIYTENYRYEKVTNMFTTLTNKRRSFFKNYKFNILNLKKKYIHH